DDILNGVNKDAWCRKERQAANRPLDGVYEAMPVEHRHQPLLQSLRCGLRAEAEIEIHHTIAGDHVARPCACMDVAYLPACRLEEPVAFVPFDSHEFGQSGCQQMDGILRELRVGDMTLHSFDGESSAHRAAAPILDRVAGSLDSRGLAHD